MKTIFNVPFGPKKSIILQILIFLFSFLNLNIIGQLTTDWKRVTWRDKDIQNHGGLSQALSGDEWWYSHKNIYDGTVHIGYVAVGYLADLVHPGDEQKIRDAFNEGSDSPYNPYPASGNFFLTPTATPIFDGGCDEFYNIFGASTLTPMAEQRTQFRGMVARLDLQGNMVWCRIATIDGSGLQEVEVKNGSIYVIGTHQGAKTTAINSGTVMNKSFLGYNPTSAGTATSAVFSTTNSIPAGEGHHMFVGKYDLNGNKQWAFLYGEQSFSNPTTAWQSASLGEDLVFHSNGNIYAVGRAASTASPSVPVNLFAAEISTLTGFITNHTVFPLPNNYNLFGSPVWYMEGHAICEDNNGNMEIGCLGQFVTTTVTSNYSARGFVYSITPSLTLNSSWSVNPVTFPQHGSYPTTFSNSTVWDITCHSITHEILVPVVNNCDGCVSSGNNNTGYGEIYRLNPTTGATSTLGGGASVNPANFGPVAAYDLRLGVTETSDGGFAAISARKNYTVFDAPSANDLGSYSVCTTFTAAPTATAGFLLWDIDPIIVKYLQYGTYHQDWIEDVSPGRQRALPPGDFKRQECMYHITEAWDGGLVASGNCSYNHDDNYMVKLYSDCQQGISFTSSSDMTVSTSTTWSVTRSVKGKVTIQNGAALTISGIRVTFADSKACGVPTYIEVQRGGTLNIVGGAILTSVANSVCPNSMWDGIAVMGTVTAAQTGTNQGYVIMNNGTISNARNGITTGNQYSNGIFNWGSQGGIIKAEDSYFINNNRDIQYIAYLPSSGANNVGYFQNCHFLITDELNDRTNPTGRVSLFGVRGIRFEGCEFVYTAGSTYPATNRGYGILSADATFTVSDYLSTQSTFKDLTLGIGVLNSSSNSTMKVNHAVFTNTFTISSAFTSGIYLSGCNYANIEDCTFDLTDGFNEALFLDHCKFYSVRSNTFTGHSSGNQVGIRVSDSQDGAHQIYRNTFSDQWVGIYSQLSNSNYTNNPPSVPTSTDPPDDGLVMNCNVFAGGDQYDILMDGDPIPGNYPCVARDQGILTVPFPPSVSDKFKLVRNQYSALCGSANQWFITPSVSAKLISHATNSNSVCQPTPVTCSNTLVTILNSTTDFTFSVQCDPNANRPVSNPSCSCKFCCLYDDISLDLSNRLARTSTLTAQYTSLIDGGDTDGLLAAIDGPYSNDDLQAILSTYRPYLSDTVLKMYFSKGSVPVSYVIQVHNENRPVTPAVWQTILDRNFNSPNQDTLEAHQALDPLSVRQALVDHLNYERSGLEFVYGEKIGYFLRDTTENARDTVIKLLSENLGCLQDAPIQLVDAYANGGYYSRAFDYADSLKNVAKYTELLTLKMAILELDTAQAKIYKILTDETLKETISEYANDSLKAGYYLARAVMHQVYGEDMHPRRLMFDDGSSRIADNQTNYEIFTNNPTDNLNQTIKASGFKIYPNPTDNTFRLLYTDVNDGSAIFTIRDLLGKEMQSEKLEFNKPKEVGTDYLPNGIYFITLFKDQKLLERQKLIIMR